MRVRWVCDGQIVLLGSTRMKPDPKQTLDSLASSRGPLIIPTKEKAKTTEDASLEDKDVTQKKLHSNVLGLLRNPQSKQLIGELC